MTTNSRTDSRPRTSEMPAVGRVVLYVLLLAVASVTLLPSRMPVVHGQANAKDGAAGLLAQVSELKRKTESLELKIKELEQHSLLKADVFIKGKPLAANLIVDEGRNVFGVHTNAQEWGLHRADKKTREFRSKPISFSRKFSQPPLVLVSVTHLACPLDDVPDSGLNLRYQIEVEQITTTSFVIHVSTWDWSQVGVTELQWLAIGQ